MNTSSLTTATTYVIQDLFPFHPHSKNIVSFLLSSSNGPALYFDSSVSLRDGVLKVTCEIFLCEYHCQLN